MASLLSTASAVLAIFVIIIIVNQSQQPLQVPDVADGVAQSLDFAQPAILVSWWKGQSTAQSFKAVVHVPNLE